MNAPKSNAEGDVITVKVGSTTTKYRTTIAPVEVEMESGGVYRLLFGWEPDQLCPCACPNGIAHYIPGAQRVAFTVEEAVEKGWLEPV